MDATRWTRAEHAGAVVVLVALVLAHWPDVAWSRFVLAFVLIDVVGYLPGALASRRARGGPIAPTYHRLYNLAHCYLVAAIAVALWALACGAVEWAMLAVPIHLSGDRGVLGNSFKSSAAPFAARA
ncbi:MAG TPA: hypothetical protein VGT02_05520 [Methylomirabilota bacterium]|jgi:hypothetical protein|nr:hypothetical protein [Methylomirabilota bacterium]